jgi:hypothetical protein
MPVAMLFKAWVSGRSLAGIAGSNPAGDMYVCPLWILCVVRWRSLRRADHSSRGILQSALCLNVIVKRRQWGDLGPGGVVEPRRRRPQYDSSSLWKSEVLIFNIFAINDSEGPCKEFCCSEGCVYTTACQVIPYIFPMLFPVSRSEKLIKFKLMFLAPHNHQKLMVRIAGIRTWML